MSDTMDKFDSAEVKERYHYWRFRILYSTIIGYAIFYIVRKNISMAIPGIGNDLGISKASLGLFLTLHGLLYGVSKFVNGIWGDRANPRFFMAIGLLLSAVMNIFFGMSSTAILFGILWLLNGWFQGMGCPPCVKSLSNWYPASERGIRFAIWNTSHSIGAALIFLLGSFLTLFSWYNWRLAFFVPAGIAVAGAIFLFNRLRDTPESLGLPSVEAVHGHEPEVNHCEEKMSGAEFRRFVMKQVFSNPGVWFVAVASFFLYIIRYMVLDWGPTFLGEMKGISLGSAGVIVAGSEAAGIAGMLFSGWLMDKVFKSNSSLVSMLLMLICTLMVFIFWKIPVQSKLANASILCIVGFILYGAQTLLGPIVANMATKKAASTAVGLVGLFSYMSGAVSGWGIGMLVDKYKNWNASFAVAVIAGLCSVVFYAIPAIKNYNHKRSNTPEQS